MPCFDDIDEFCIDLKSMQMSGMGKKERWAVYLSALLNGKVLDVYSRLPVKDAQDYEILKDVLLKRFNLIEEGFMQKFRSVRP